MNRRQLYALGEPFGDCCTHPKQGGGYVCGGGGDSSSSSSNATTTTSIDKRQVVDGAGIGVSSDSSTVNTTYTVNQTDQGALQKASDIVTAALQKASDISTAAISANQTALSDGKSALSSAIDLQSFADTKNAQNYQVLLDTTLQLAKQSDVAFQKNIDLTTQLNAAAAGMFGQNITLAGTLAGAGKDFLNSISDQAKTTADAATSGVGINLTDTQKKTALVVVGVAVLAFAMKGK